MSRGRDRRRKLRAHETARRDQAMAYARDAEASPGTLVVVTEDADAGVQCSWCDCPDDSSSPHRQPGYTCGGCPQAADYTVQIGLGNRRIPVCERHYRDVPRAVRSWVGDVPVEFGPTWMDES